MRIYSRFLLTTAGAVTLVLAAQILPARNVAAAPPPSAQDVRIVSPLTNGSVPVQATVNGLVRILANPALTHVGVLAGEVVTFTALRGSFIYEIRSDGSNPQFSAVPSGKALIITDIGWASSGTAGGDSDFTISNGSIHVFRDRDRYDDIGAASRHVSKTTGIAFGPGTGPSFNWTGTGIFYGSTLINGYYVDVP